MFNRKKEIPKIEVREVPKVIPKLPPVPYEEEKVEVEEEPKKEEEQKTKIQVVKEFPMIPVRDFQDKDGVMVHLITIEEALTEIMNEG